MKVLPNEAAGREDAKRFTEDVQFGSQIAMGRPS